VIVHYDGNTWLPMTSGTTRNLEEVVGRDGSSVFAVGAQGTLLHYGGAAWTAVGTGTMANLNSIWVVGPDGFAVGEGGAIVQGEDLTWSPAVTDGQCRFNVCLEPL
jgi:membrane protein implicated in regulation of membrane protease activity